MADVKYDNQLEEINRKLDLISREMAAARRHREEIKELKDDLTFVAKDVFNTAVVELEDISPFIQTGDFKHLVKKLLRNIKPITETLSQLESLRDFITDMAPLNKEVFCDILHKLDDFDRKGYFKLIREFGGVVDNAVKNLSDDEITRIAENVSSLIDLLKLGSKMNIPQITQKALTTMGELDVTKFEAQSLWDIIKDFNSPDVRRLLGLILMFLTSFSKGININYKEGAANA